MFQAFTQTDRRALIALALLAFALRMFSGLLKGPEFVENGYTFYVDIAQTYWSGDGFCHGPAQDCGVRMPVYPALIAPFVSTGLAYPWLIVLKAVLGTGVAMAAALIGAMLFNRRVGLAAFAIAAVNPYAVIHGPSLQDTVLINFLAAVAILLLLLWRRIQSTPLGVACGVALGLMVLTSARMLPVAALLCAWVAMDWRRDRRKVLAVVAPAVMLIGMWCARNAYVVGAPVLTTEAGLSLWLGNHAATLDVYPMRSIDHVADLAWASLDSTTRSRLEGLESDPVALDSAYGELALSSLREHPFDLGVAGVKKVLLSFGGWLSPARSWPIQLGYSALYLPLNVLALIGLWRARHAGPDHTLILIVFAALILTTAVFWAHTSHRSYVHILKIVYAVAVIEPWLTRHLGSRSTLMRPAHAGGAFRSPAS